jgi:ADP-ribose pyrophosphatase
MRIDKMDKKVNIESTRLLLDDFYKVQEARVRFSLFNGQMSEPVRRLVFERGDSVAALIWNTDKQKLLLSNQFRYPTYEKGPGWLLEVVAGTIEEHEQPDECMQREIREEIGYQIHALQYIATFYVSPGGSSERIILYYAEVRNVDKVAAGGGAADEHEDIELVELTLEELWQKMEQNEIQDAKTLIAAQWLRLRAGEMSI